MFFDCCFKNKRLIMGLAQYIAKKDPLRPLRDMGPYYGILEEIAKFFRAGGHIDILEIGVRRGISTKAFLRGLRDRKQLGYGTGHLHSIDITDRSRVVRTEELRKMWTFYHGDSKVVEWNKEVDILMLDGDHSYPSCKADWVKYEPFVKPGGMIIMHDVTCRLFGVKDVWAEIKYPKAVLGLNSVGLGLINKP